MRAREALDKGDVTTAAPLISDLSSISELSQERDVARRRPRRGESGATARVGGIS